MVQINFARKEVSCKIVYYGPGLSGKTTNLQVVHEKMPVDNKGKLTSIATEGERTLFFDFLPLDLGSVAGMETKFQLYTVPGQVYYNATRKLVLKGVDGVVFVADSQPEKMAENLQSWQNLQDNLAEHGLTLEDVPVVFQYNKRDLPDAVSVQLMNDRLNAIDAPWCEAVATQGNGVLPTLRTMAGLVLDGLNQPGAGAVGHQRATPIVARRAQGGDVAAAAAAPAAVAETPSTPAPQAEPDETVAVQRPAAAAETMAAPGRVDRAVAGARAVVRPRHRVASRPPAAAPPRRPAPVPARPLVEEAIGSGSGSASAVAPRRSRAWMAVVASVLIAVLAAAAAFFLWFRG